MHSIAVLHDTLQAVCIKLWSGRIQLSLSVVIVEAAISSINASTSFGTRGLIVLLYLVAIVVPVAIFLFPCPSPLLHFCPCQCFDRCLCHHPASSSGFYAQKFEMMISHVHLSKAIRLLRQLLVPGRLIPGSGRSRPVPPHACALSMMDPAGVAARALYAKNN